jgi:hypothetical protein
VFNFFINVACQGDLRIELKSERANSPAGSKKIEKLKIRIHFFFFFFFAIFTASKKLKADNKRQMLYINVS